MEFTIDSTPTEKIYNKIGDYKSRSLHIYTEFI